MGNHRNPGVVTNGHSFKNAIERRWKHQLEKKDTERYRNVLEEELAEETIDEIDSQPAGCAHYREQGRHLLHSKHVLRAIVALCIVDCILLMSELFLDTEAVRSDLVDRFGSGGEKCIKVKDNSSNRHKRAASADTGVDYGINSPYASIAYYCHYVSVSILILLTVETLIKIFCFGNRLFRSKLEVFDAMFVIASMVADSLLLESVTFNPPLLSIAVANVLLPCRVIRVVNSLIIATRDHEHFKLLLVYRAKQLAVDDLFIAMRQLELTWDKNKNLMNVYSKAGLHFKMSDNGLLETDGVAVTNEKEKGELTGDVSCCIEDNVRQANPSPKGDNSLQPVTRMNENSDPNASIKTEL